MSDGKFPTGDEMKAVLEALIYVSEEPVREEDLLRLFPPGSEQAVHQALEELMTEYSAVPRGLSMMRVGGGYRMQTRPEHDPWIRSLYRLRNRVRLSRAALETLAIIAYRQPITTPEIQAIRGIQPMGVIQTLLERKLIRVLGRKKVVGKPIVYGTSPEFLVHFGLNSLADLPSLEDFAEAGGPEEIGPAAVPRMMEGILSSGPEVRAEPFEETEAVSELPWTGPLPSDAPPEAADTTRDLDEEE